MEGCIKFNRGTKPPLLSPAPSSLGGLSCSRGYLCHHWGPHWHGTYRCLPDPIPVPVLFLSCCFQQRQPRWLPWEHQQEPRQPLLAVGGDEAAATSVHEWFPFPWCIPQTLRVGLQRTRESIFGFWLFDIPLVVSI